MKLPAMNELLRIIAAAGITLLVVALAIMFFMWVFSSADREHRRVQPLAVSSSTERSRSISASWRSILRTSSPIIANSTMMPVKATENPIIYSTAVSTARGRILRAVAPGPRHLPRLGQRHGRPSGLHRQKAATQPAALRGNPIEHGNIHAPRVSLCSSLARARAFDGRRSVAELVEVLNQGPAARDRLCQRAGAGRDRRRDAVPSHRAGADAGRHPSARSHHRPEADGQCLHRRHRGRCDRRDPSRQQGDPRARRHRPGPRHRRHRLPDRGHRAVGDPRADLLLRRRGTGRAGGPPGRAVRRPGRPAADSPHRGHRADPGRRLHRERGQMPPVRATAIRNPTRSTPAGRISKRSSSSSANGRRHARQLRHQAPARDQGRHHEVARARVPVP